METTNAPVPPDPNSWSFSKANKFSHLLASPMSVSCAKPNWLRMWKELKPCSKTPSLQVHLQSLLPWLKPGFLEPTTPNTPIGHPLSLTNGKLNPTLT